MDVRGIRAPSLYKHVEGELEALLIVDVFREMGQLFHDALAHASKGGSRKKVLAELARAYRSWALAHPHLYRLCDRGALPRKRRPRASRRRGPSRS